jgi:hypothetical protein
MEREAVAGSLGPKVSAMFCHPAASEAGEEAATERDTKRSESASKYVA